MKRKDTKTLMKFYYSCFLLSCLFVFLGCAAEPNIDNKLVVISDADTPPDEVILWGDVTFGAPIRTTWPAYAYVVNIPPTLTNDVLTVNVSYAGGCKEHDFTLVLSDAFQESHPVKVQAILAHNANGDSCEAWITETYHFNVSVLKERYQKAYRTETGTIVLSIKGIPGFVYTF